MRASRARRSSAPAGRVVQSLSRRPPRHPDRRSAKRRRSTPTGDRISSACAVLCMLQISDGALLKLFTCLHGVSNFLQDAAEMSCQRAVDLCRVTELSRFELRSSMWHALRQLFCFHRNYGVAAEAGRMFLRCRNCGHRTTGWVIKPGLAEDDVHQSRDAGAGRTAPAVQRPASAG